ncbi:hypothetical protein CerSpe_166130 [Prunus speciosa]
MLDLKRNIVRSPKRKFLSEEMISGEKTNMLSDYYANSDTADMINMEPNQYANLFSHNSASLDDVALPNLFPEVNVVDLYSLGKNAEFSEVKDSLFNIGGLKALEVDGFPVCFYQNQWKTYANDIFELVSISFHGVVGQNV